jgi:hypothetical protein
MRRVMYIGGAISVCSLSAELALGLRLGPVLATLGLHRCLPVQLLHDMRLNAHARSKVREPAGTNVTGVTW